MNPLIKNYNLFPSVINFVGNGSWDAFYPGYILVFYSDATGSTPYHIIGGNQATVIQINPGQNAFSRQFAFGFGTNKIATRGTLNGAWGEWMEVSI